MDVHDALKVGLADHIAEESTAEEVALRVAREIAQGGPVALRLAKQVSAGAGACIVELCASFATSSC